MALLRFDRGQRSMVGEVLRKAIRGKAGAGSAFRLAIIEHIALLTKVNDPLLETFTLAR
jgi:hypothetical protein